METYNFKSEAKTRLSQLYGLLEDGQKMGFDLSAIKSKLESVEQGLEDGIIRIVLLGAVSDGKTSAIAGLLGRLEDTMKIDQDESSDELTIYRPADLREGFEIIDTPGLFGTKEKELDGRNVKFSEITERYISEAHLIIYVCDAVTPLKDSHTEIIRKVLREYKKLDSTVFVINKMDEAGYNIRDEKSFDKGANIKKNSLISRLQKAIGLTPEEEAKLNMVCIAADPKRKGLPYWFEKTDEYMALSRIGDLRKTIDSVIEQSDEMHLKSDTLDSAVKDMVVGLYQLVSSSNTPVEKYLTKVEYTIKELELKESELRDNIKELKRDARSRLASLRERLYNGIEGASVETISGFIEMELGISDNKIDFHVFNSNVESILSDCFDDANSKYDLEVASFKETFDLEDNGLMIDLGKGAAKVLGKVNLNNKNILAARDVIAKGYKFKPHGAGNLAKGINKAVGRGALVLAVAFEVWEWYSKITNENKLHQLKSELKGTIE